MNKIKEVAFFNGDLAKSFSDLKSGKFEDKQLYNFINRALDDLKKEPSTGIKIPKKLWPKEYRQYNLINLWKYNLPNAWRLMYTVAENKIKIISVVLEWMSHKEYEKRFKY